MLNIPITSLSNISMVGFFVEKLHFFSVSKGNDSIWRYTPCFNDYPRKIDPSPRIPLVSSDVLVFLGIVWSLKTPMVFVSFATSLARNKSNKMWNSNLLFRYFRVVPTLHTYPPTRKRNDHISHQVFTGFGTRKYQIDSEGAGTFSRGYAGGNWRVCWVEIQKIGGKPPKWMVKIMENPIKWMIWGEKPLFLETSTKNALGKLRRLSTSSCLQRRLEKWWICFTRIAKSQKKSVQCQKKKRTSPKRWEALSKQHHLLILRANHWFNRVILTYFHPFIISPWLFHWYFKTQAIFNEDPVMNREPPRK